VLVLDPVVDNAHATTLASSLDGKAQLTNSATALDDVATRRILQQLVLHFTVFVVREQPREQARKGLRLDEFHGISIYANGGYIKSAGCGSE